MFVRTRERLPLPPDQPDLGIATANPVNCSLYFSRFKAFQAEFALLGQRMKSGTFSDAES
jgi:hypothetical protein